MLLVFFWHKLWNYNVIPVNSDYMDKDFDLERAAEETILPKQFSKIIIDQIQPLLSCTSSWKDVWEAIRTHFNIKCNKYNSEHFDWRSPFGLYFQIYTLCLSSQILAVNVHVLRHNLLRVGHPYTDEWKQIPALHTRLWRERDCDVFMQHWLHTAG